MSGYISEFFGYRAEDSSDTALQNTSKQVYVPFCHLTVPKRLEIEQIERSLVFVR